MCEKETWSPFMRSTSAALSVIPAVTLVALQEAYAEAMGAGVLCWGKKDDFVIAHYHCSVFPTLCEALLGLPQRAIHTEEEGPIQIVHTGTYFVANF